MDASCLIYLGQGFDNDRIGCLLLVEMILRKMGKGCRVIAVRNRASTVGVAHARVGQNLALPPRCLEEDEASHAKAIAKRFVTGKMQIQV